MNRNPVDLDRDQGRGRQDFGNRLGRSGNPVSGWQMLESQREILIDGTHGTGLLSRK